MVLVYTTYLWCFGEWFILVLPTLTTPQSPTNNPEKSPPQSSPAISAGFNAFGSAAREAGLAGDAKVAMDPSGALAFIGSLAIWWRGWDLGTESGG